MASASFTGAARGRLRAPKPRVPKFPATRPALPPRRALPADDATVSHLHHLLTLALEPLYMPCSGMKCGDIIYRSTLDPSLRLEERGVNPQLVALGAAALLYLFAKPGIFPGFVDYYFLAPAYSLLRKKVRQEEIVLGKVIGTGGFGKVYKAKLRSGGPEELVVKKAYDYGEAEVWMNERLERVCPNRVPKFIDAFEGPKEKRNERPPLWLVWQFEGEGTLADAIQSKDFPENLEERVLGRKLGEQVPEARRRQAVIRALLKDVLDALNEIHRTGIVHRDVKPENILLPSQGKRGKVKFIDFGAAADLRVGINYLPKEFLLDPRYAPPEKYIMSTSTPKAPPTPVAAALSPVLWSLNRPDRFDMYSVGILLLQMCFPPLRRDNQLVAFNRQLGGLDYDILAWRDLIVSKKGGSGGYAQGIEILDMDGGRGWDLLRRLINNSPSRRIGASAAASHPFVSNFGLGVLPVLLEQVGEILPEGAKRQSDWLVDKAARGAELGLTEAEVEDIRTKNKSKTVREREVAALFDPKTSKTISWWSQRERGTAFARRPAGGGAARSRNERVLSAFSWKAKKTIDSYTRGGGKGKSLLDLVGSFRKKGKYKTSG